MIPILPPAVIFIVGALLVPLFRGRLKSAYMLFLPVLAFISLLSMPEGKVVKGYEIAAFEDAFSRYLTLSPLD